MEKTSKDTSFESDSQPAGEEKQAKKKPKEQATGSRWAALLLLVITIVLSLVFYFQGRWALFGGAKGVREPVQENSGETWEFSVE